MEIGKNYRVYMCVESNENEKELARKRKLV